MSATEYCPSCSEGILWKCNSCEKENDRSIHTYHATSREEWTTTATSAPASVVGLLVSVASSLTMVAHV
ncbi:MAG TPA: hypothetical protein VLA68_00215 [Nitrososphaera sp.]|nr:hypothetical protein [Nitrososphaera sp.]